MNQLIAFALAEKVSVLERADRASENKFSAVLNKVSNNEAVDYDKL